MFFKGKVKEENPVKLAIIYYSSTGTNYQMAKWAEAAAIEAGADVKLLRIQETAPQEAINSNPAWKAFMEKSKDVPEVQLSDLVWADAFIFSIPTRFGNVPGQVKQFIDTAGGLWYNGKLANKVASAMTSAQNVHGGQEQTLLQIYTTMYHWGVIVATPGYTDPSVFTAGGNPFGTSVTVGKDGQIIEDAKAAVKYQARRTIQVGSWIKAGIQD
ncbi:NAD(P)H:quinone oxidoreductase [Solibacillus silvestris]